ncbi:YbjN domain-containing protein [Pseudothioclava arenosa]|uniref:YbjN domain-containing protein n=1 Tax=Pseudothioclava arenosa TaxID=1795308 RepID=A0A2A4CMP1_9RHOB|nr:YbjN domain-containing protein [Pseudothioclava arenosa]PCD76511.1 YbjN domain-containing protein [Pseudothioclava arenosa]
MKFLALALGFALAAPAANAQVMADVDVIAVFLQEFGLPTEKTVDPDGDPKIESRIEGTRFAVYFYGCDNGKECDSIQFSTGFDLKEPMTLEAANAWNRDKRFGKVYLDEDGDPYIEYDVNTDFDGIGSENFDDSIDLWRALLAEFRDYIDW